MSFRIPKWKQKTPDKELFTDLAHFDWSEVDQQTLLGQGAYRVVNVIHYREEMLCWKFPVKITGIGKEFTKEVKLLNSVRGHQNVISFKALCICPYAIITEYVVFSFEPFDKKVVSLLSDFLGVFIRITISKDLNMLYP